MFASKNVRQTENEDEKKSSVPSSSPSSPLPESSSTHSMQSPFSLSELDECLEKLTIDKRIKIQRSSARRNPFKIRKNITFSEFSLKNKFKNKSIETVTNEMATLWNENGYREMIGKRKNTLTKDETTQDAASSSKSSSSSSTNTTESNPNENLTCARQANCDYNDSTSVIELAAYFEEGLFFPKKMSFMAEMMYT